ncbi:hypothetical protein MHAE_13645 [Mycobacterium haemophilum DSM 44634]|nr:hypothetical protein B586_18185 [Mycobacterium haemophilum DSM 44634]MCV7340873.1 hypothetical protein [Mycobacterium haemophilum DSM 44634]
MPEFGYAFGDQPALDEVARTDLLLDALAERHSVDFDDPRDDMLAALLEDWRDELRWPPASALVSHEQAVEALYTGIAGRRRARRGLAAIGSVAATLLVLSGLGAVVADARPGQALYGLHTMFFDTPRVNNDQIVLSAKAELAKVQQMIAEGQWDQAEDQLAEVSSSVQSMDDDNRRNDLMNQVNLLNTKVETHDPNATLPAPETGPTVPAASTTLTWSSIPPEPPGAAP